MRGFDILQLCVDDEQKSKEKRNDKKGKKKEEKESGRISKSICVFSCVYRCYISTRCELVVVVVDDVSFYFSGKGGNVRKERFLFFTLLLSSYNNIFLFFSFLPSFNILFHSLLFALCRQRTHIYVLLPALSLFSRLLVDLDDDDDVVGKTATVLVVLFQQTKKLMCYCYA